MNEEFDKLREIRRTGTLGDYISARDSLRSNFSENEWDELCRTDSWSEAGMSVVRILDVKFTTLHWDLFLKYCSTPPVTPLIDRALVGKAKGRFEYSKWAPFATNQNLQDSGLPSVEREPPNYEIPRENRTIGSRLDEAETMGFFDDDIRDDYA